MSERIAILGGTFDPIHCGHMDAGEAALLALQSAALLVVPLNTPPHRVPPTASGFHRFAMAALAVAGRSRWQVSDLELKHAEPSYTATTLRRFHEQGYAPQDLFFVIGADAFLDIRSWKDFPGILDAARFAVVSRPGFPVGKLPDRLPDLAPRMAPASARNALAAASIILIDARTADVSSTAIRRRCTEGASLAGLVPVAVQQHIEQHGLYRSMIHDSPASRHETDAPAGRLHGQS
jgi:nicotinate-nucleotide adenylyltransferase